MVAGTRLLLDAPESLQHGDKLRPKSRRVMLRLVAILAVGCRSVEEGNARTSQRHNQGCGELGRTLYPLSKLAEVRLAKSVVRLRSTSVNVRPSVKTRQKY